MKVLVVEDDRRLCSLIARGLSEDGHVVDTAGDGLGGQEAARTGRYDAIVMDLMLPKKDGLSVIRELRDDGIVTPILILTSRDSTDDVVAGLDAGADDYLRKPFAFEEMEARLRTIARRLPVPPRRVLEVEDVTFDLATKRVHRAGREIVLKAKELAFLEYLMMNAGVVVTRAMIEEAIWARHSEICSNVVDVYIRRLRSKLEADGLPQIIFTVRGVGYRFGSC
jgi:DNA-binding response OmpR family regulator